MLGHNVKAFLCDPEEERYAELRKQDETGIWLYYGWAEQARMHFIPMRRVVSMEDYGAIRR